MWGVGGGGGVVYLQSGREAEITYPNAGPMKTLEHMRAF